MNRKKMMPLVFLAVCVVVLGVLLAVLQSAQTEETQGLALCDFTADEIDRLSYSGNNVEATLLKGNEGSWMLESDPALPLDQDVVSNLITKFAGLTAQRQLQDSELSEIPARSDTPLMVFEIASGETARTLTVDQANDVADIYYVYDENGTTYTVDQTDLAGLCKDPRDLYKTQTLTDKTIDDVATMQVEDLQFTQTDCNWTLTDDPTYPLDQDAVQKMANTLCGVQADWTVTTPEADSVYGLDTPDVTATVTFTDGTSLTVRFGALTDSDETLCYLASSDAPTVVYEVNAEYKTAFAVTKETLYDDTATAETAEEDTDSIVAEQPVGGKNDYADAQQNNE